VRGREGHHQDSQPGRDALVRLRRLRSAG
jgi:hypothetical protein